MNISPEIFLQSLKEGKTERELNLKESLEVNLLEVNKLVNNGHSVESATSYLQTDYSNGFTICSGCGSFYSLGKGFQKHLSNGCLHCEGETKHKVYYVEASSPAYGGFPARYMSLMFDDGMNYEVAKLQKGKYKKLLT